MAVAVGKGALIRIHAGYNSTLHRRTHSEAVVPVNEVWGAEFGGAEEEVLQFPWLWQTLLLDHQLPQNTVYHTVLVCVCV